MTKRPNSHKAAPAPKHASTGTGSRRPLLASRLPPLLADIPLMVAAGLFAVVTLLLALGCPDYLMRIEAMSLFMPTSLFTADFLATPGGILELAARWLTQLMHKPWLGAAVYAALLAAVQYTGCRAFGIRRWWALAFLALPLWLLWGMLGMGYMIFTVKTPGFAMQAPLGVLCALIVGCSPRLTRRVPVLVALALMTAFAGYYVMGVYALLAVACMIVCALTARLPRTSVVAVAVAGVLGCAVAPRACFAVSSGTLQRQHMYGAALPRANVGQWRLWLPAQPTALTDGNFRLTLALQRAIDEGRWADAIALASKQTGEPTRLNTVLASIAMMHAGVAADAMFTLPVGNAPYASADPTAALLDAGAISISYNLGQINYAYRWAMEHAVEHGMSVEYLKYLAKCAIVNGEMPLADKYLDALSMTMMHRDWARQYRKYVKKPESVASDPELAAILAIKSNDNFLASDDGRLEGFVWPLLQHMRARNPQQLQLSMIADLVRCDLDNFMSKMPTYLESAAGAALPRHFQEAVLLWSAINGTQEYLRYPIDRQTQESFARFVETSNATEGLSGADLRKRLEPYVSTYWYYYNVSPDIKIR